MLILRPKKWVGYILILFTQRHYILDSALNAGDAWLLAGVLKSSNLLFKRVSRWTSLPSYKHKKNPSKFQLNTWRDWQVFKLNTWRDFSISASLREASSTLNGNLVNVVSDQNLRSHSFFHQIAHFGPLLPFNSLSPFSGLSIATRYESHRRSYWKCSHLLLPNTLIMSYQCAFFF